MFTRLVSSSRGIGTTTHGHDKLGRAGDQGASAGRLPSDAAHGPSVPILKLLCTFCLSVECAATEALDGCQDVIGGFGPAERLGRGISDFD
jgi:hypothetical protein